MSYYKNFADGMHIKEQGKAKQRAKEIQDEFERKRHEMMLSHVKKKNPKLLEIGSGTGSFAEFCKKKGIRYYGVEPQEDLFKKLSKKFNVKKARVPPIPFKKSEFDVVIHSHVLEHMESAKKAYDFLSECNKVLKSDGIMVFRCPNILTWGRDFWDVDYTHSFPTSPTRVNQLLYDCGFKIKHFEEISFLKPRYLGKFRFILPNIKALNALYPKISKFLGNFIKKDTELLYVCTK